jgi:predicted HTH transcriptional regulator
VKYRIFISSVQREFAKERKALAEYLRKDAILGRFFEVFLFEEVPAQERKADGVYLAEVDDCDIYLGIFGHTYGNVDSRGVSATEREYRRAAAKHKYRICFVDKSAGETDQREAAFISRVNDDVVRKGFVGYDDLRTAVYAALAKHLEDKGLINVLPFDAAKTAGVAIKDLSVAKIRDFIRTAREKRQFSLPVNSSVEKLLTALELIDDDGNVLNPAALLFGKRPQKFFVASEVKCAQFYADRVSKPMADHQIYMGDVFELADQATRFVMSHISNWVGTRETGDTAEVPTKFELPYDAVKEAIVNAIVHRDYTSNASVQVMLFKDRLEVWSPGSLPHGMTIGKLSKTHKSVPVNPLLARAMYLKGYIEKSGTGTEDMIAKCKEWGVPAPEWTEDDADDFRVILKRPVSEPDEGKTMVKPMVKTMVKTMVKSRVKSSVESRVKSSVKRRARKLSSTEKIIAYLTANPSAAAHELSIAVKLSVRGVEWHLKALVKSGKLRHVGPSRGGHWEVLS